jgi:hypothetical protein
MTDDYSCDSLLSLTGSQSSGKGDADLMKSIKLLTVSLCALSGAGLAVGVPGQAATLPSPQVITGVSSLFRGASAVAAVGPARLVRKVAPNLRESWINKTACGTAVLYSSDQLLNTIDIYPQGTTNQGPCGQLTTKSHLALPHGLFVDGSGNLWVANTSQSEIIEFAPLSKKVLKTLYDPLGQPGDVVVDPNTGTVYVANIFGPHLSQGNVIAYDGGSTEPTRTLADSNIARTSGITIDNRSNVYATVYNSTFVADVHEWQGGTGSAIDLGITGLQSPGGIETTQSGALLLCDPNGAMCGEILPTTTTLTNIFAADGGSPNNASLNAAGTIAFTADYSNNVIDAWNYPGPDMSPLYEDNVGIPSTYFVAASPAAAPGVPFTSGARRRSVH